MQNLRCGAVNTHIQECFPSRKAFWHQYYYMILFRLCLDITKFLNCTWAVTSVILEDTWALQRDNIGVIILYPIFANFWILLCTSAYCFMYIYIFFLCYTFADFYILLPLPTFEYLYIQFHTIESVCIIYLTLQCFCIFLEIFGYYWILLKLSVFYFWRTFTYFFSLFGVLLD